MTFNKGTRLNQKYETGVAARSSETTIRLFSSTSHTDPTCPDGFLYLSPCSWRSWWRRTASKWRWTALTCWSTSTESGDWRRWLWCAWSETSSSTVQPRAWSESQRQPRAVQETCVKLYHWISASNSPSNDLMHLLGFKRHNRQRSAIFAHQALHHVFQNRGTQVCTLIILFFFTGWCLIV